MGALRATLAKPGSPPPGDAELRPYAGPEGLGPLRRALRPSIPTRVHTAPGPRRRRPRAPALSGSPESPSRGEPWFVS